MKNAKKKILTIIPARSGSKGVPGKNIIDVNGKPLLAYSIEPALELKRSKKTDAVIVSTDSNEIAEIAQKYGAETPFLRPKSISGDQAKSVDLILHALTFYESLGVTYEAVLLLQPTSPLRTFENLNSAVELFQDCDNDSLISVYKEDYINDLVLYRISDDGRNSLPLSSLHNRGVRRQDHGPVYVRNGCIYISSVELIKKGFIIGERPLLYVMDKSRSINVDTQEDLDLLRKLV